MSIMCLHLYLFLQQSLEIIDRDKWCHKDLASIIAAFISIQARGLGQQQPHLPPLMVQLGLAKGMLFPVYSFLVKRTFCKSSLVKGIVSLDLALQSPGKAGSLLQRIDRPNLKFCHPFWPTKSTLLKVWWVGGTFFSCWFKNVEIRVLLVYFQAMMMAYLNKVWLAFISLLVLFYLL